MAVLKSYAQAHVLSARAIPVLRKLAPRSHAADSSMYFAELLQTASQLHALILLYLLTVSPYVLPSMGVCPSLSVVCRARCGPRWTGVC